MPTGKLVKTFGASMFVFPHGINVDRDGNVWVTDGRGQGRQGPSGVQVQPRRQGADDARQARRGGQRARHVQRAVRGRWSRPNGDIFVADGHGAETNARVVKFTKDGKFIKAWGKKGTGPGEFDMPHTIAIDSAGPPVRRRPQQQPHPDLRPGRQVPRPVDAVQPAERHRDRQARTTSTSPTWQSGVGVEESRRLEARHPHRQLKDGVVTAFIPDPVEKAKTTSAAEGIAVDAQGNIYGAEVTEPADREIRQEVERRNPSTQGFVIGNASEEDVQCDIQPG